MSQNPDPLQAEKDQIMGQNVGGKLNLLNENEVIHCARALHEFRAQRPRIETPPKKDPPPPPPKKDEPAIPGVTVPLKVPRAPSWAEYDSLKDPYESGRYWDTNKTALIEQARIIQQLEKEDARKNH